MTCHSCRSPSNSIQQPQWAGSPSMSCCHLPSSSGRLPVSASATSSQLPAARACSLYPGPTSALPSDCADGQDCNFPVTLRSRSSRLRPNPNCDGAYGSQKRDTKNSHQRRGGRNDSFGRFRDTETASRPANGAESRASLVLIRNNRRRLDCLADDAVGFEPVSPVLPCFFPVYPCLFKNVGFPRSGFRGDFAGF